MFQNMVKSSLISGGHIRPEYGGAGYDIRCNPSFKHFVVECEFIEKSLFYDWFNMHRECRQTFLFSNSAYYTNYS